MNTIKVNRGVLLDKLQSNRAQHAEDYEKAMKVWVKKSTKALKKAAATAADSGWIEEDPLKEFPKPKSYLKSYDDAVARVSMDTREELELNDLEFSAWVQDDWNWRGQFVANTSIYNH